LESSHVCCNEAYVREVKEEEGVSVGTRYKM